MADSKPRRKRGIPVVTFEQIMAVGTAYKTWVADRNDNGLKQRLSNVGVEVKTDAGGRIL